MTESRPYTTWSPDKSKDSVHSNSGIVAAKAELNRLHQKLAKEGYTQVVFLFHMYNINRKLLTWKSLTYDFYCSVSNNHLEVVSIP